MCRHIGYVGPPIPVGDLLTRGPHSLRTQSWAPRDMRGGGTINADGFGVAWWLPTAAAPTDHGAGTAWHGGTAPDVTAFARAEAHAASEPGATDAAAGTSGRGDPVPLSVSRYRNAAPIWTDPAVDEVLPQIRSTAVLGAVRSATVGLPLDRGACAPFTRGRWAFSHNGAIPGWRDVLADIAAKFDSPPLLAAESLTDSAVLWVILHDLLERTAGGDAETDVGAAVRPDPADALRRLVAAVVERSPQARLNLLLGDGRTWWATTWHHSLSVLATDTFAIVASEPYDDDPRWRPIADRQVVVAGPGRLVVEDLAIETGRARS
ncbi:class II glutamine amidotransferase domain-containing protein [Nocardia otitidiscaviarum]|uniref:ergothioneine biosynthesis protein EgtC n=1 Tax=Nocardia otitidiscaviarum TaxID=1823 RepID=UPI001E2D6BE6|nr:ergothioneine biosynthesis protein EgtC [Nocardia otitidiscaviarum]